jgi:hypothetical protein
MDLNIASNEELNAFKVAVCATNGIDPLMLDYIWMNDPETGLRNRVLYAKRGAAEVLRKNLGISITSLIQSESNGLISFTATGVDKSGRQEMAVGSAYIEGRKGDKLAHALMTAQTKAVRRVTLQFVTGGVLDETEVQAQNDLPAPSAASGAALAGSPLVVPPPLAPTAINAAPGKDITPVTDFPPPTKIEQVLSPEGVKSANEMAKELGYAIQTPEEFSAAQQALRDEAKAQLDANPPAKQKRTRKARNSVSISSPGQEPNPAKPVTPAQQLTAAPPAPVSTPAAEVPVSAPPVVAVEKAQPVVAQLPAPPLSIAMTHQPVPQPPPSAPPTAALDPEKAKEFKERLRVYYNDVLPKGGMLPVERIGGVTMQLRTFAQIHTGAEHVNALSLAQWEDLFEFLDNYTAKNGVVELVKYIQKSIGAK